MLAHNNCLSREFLVVVSLFVRKSLIFEIRILLVILFFTLENIRYKRFSDNTDLRQEVLNI